MIAESSRREALERARQLAEAGRHDEALAVLQDHLRASPDDGEALNDAGAILYAAGRFDEAADHLRRAADRLADDAGQALWNLAEVCLAAGRPAEVLPLFDRLAKAELMTADLANRVATALLDRGDAAGAVEALLGSFRVSPGQDVLLPVVERVRAMRPKVAFFCEFDDVKFIKDIYAYTSARFETRLVRGQDRDATARLLDWCDIAWLEWCTPQAVLASRRPKTCRTIVRLHRFEAFGPWPAGVRWENIDALVTVGNPAVLERLRQKVPDLERRTRVLEIPNGVDLDRFAFAGRPRGKRLACVGYLSLHKNPMLLLQALAKLRAADPEYRLHFAGRFQDDGVLETYLRHMAAEMGLAEAVTFDGWQDDVAAWLQDKHYLVSASIVEGHPVGVLEGMARGLKPVVHAFPGCRAFFPPAYLWRTVDEFCERILADPYRPEEYREFVAARFPLKTQLEQVGALLLEMERRPVAKAAAAAPPAAAPGLRIG